MSVTLVLGLQMGDEGKGKTISTLSQKNDIIVRFSGGSNASHSFVQKDKKIKHHQLPSGSYINEKTLVLTSGMLIDPCFLLKEIKELRESGCENRIIISPHAHVIMPYHKIISHLKENQRGSYKIGTSRQGCGPAYLDKVARTGIRVEDLINPVILKKKIKINLKEKSKILKKPSVGELVKYIYGSGGLNDLSLYDVFKWAYNCGNYLKPYIDDTASFLWSAWKEDKHILLEGAQATLVDISWGLYPYVTSSDCTAGYACISTGLPPKALNETIGVIKPYVTHQGRGPFPTELFNSKEEFYFRNITKEYTHRVGWLDLIALKYAIRLNGITKLAITNIDRLSGFKKIPMALKYTINGRECPNFLPVIPFIEKVKPEFIELPGWKKNIRGLRKIEDLPVEVTNFLKFFEETFNIPVNLLSTGPAPEDSIFINNS